MGLGYKGGASKYRSIGDNAGDLASSYGLKNGYFGVKSQSNKNSVRNISSADPQATAREFYDKAAYGGIENALKDKNGNVKGSITKMRDGTIITWRNVSHSDGSPAVDINIEYSSDSGGIRGQKIHFVKGVTDEKN